MAARAHRRGGPGLLGTSAGVALSLVPVVLVLLVADGMIEGITGRFLELDSYHLRVPAHGLDRAALDELIGDIRTVPTVIVAEHELRSLALLFADGARAGAEVRFVSPELLASDGGLASYLRVEGEFDLATDDQVVIGREIAETLHVGLGDPVALLSQGASRVTILSVAGIYRSGYQQLDGAWVFLASSAAARIGAAGSSFIGVKVIDPFRGLADVIDDLRSVIPPQAIMSTWFELQRATYQSFRATKVWLTFIMAVIALVAAASVATALRMMVRDRTADLAFLRAIGGSPDQIGLALLTTGLLAGAVGSIGGIVLGLAASVNANELLAGLERILNAAAALIGPDSEAPITVIDRTFYLEEIPVRANLGELLLVAGATTTAAAVAAVRPAMHAARILPVEALRER